MAFASQMFFPQKCLVATVKCGLTLLLNVHDCFPSFHNGVKKLCIVTWPSERENLFEIATVSIFPVFLLSTSLFFAFAFNAKSFAIVVILYLSFFSTANLDGTGKSCLCIFCYCCSRCVWPILDLLTFHALSYHVL